MTSLQLRRQRIAVARLTPTAPAIDPGSDPGAGGGTGGGVDTSTQYLRSAGTVGQMASTPDQTAFDAISTGSFCVVMRLSLDTWTPTGTERLCGMYDGTASTSTWRLSVTAGGFFNFTVSTGTGFNNGDSTVAVPTTVTDGTVIWLRVTVSSTTGQVAYYYADDQLALPTTWTTIQANRGAFTFPINNGTTAFTVGSVPNATTPAIANIYRTMLFTGTSPNTGTLIADMNAADATIGNTTWLSSTTNETWSLVGGIAINSGGSTGGGGGGGTTLGSPPAMPTTSKDSTWQLQWSTKFKYLAVETTLLATGSRYAGPKPTVAIDEGTFSAYTYPSYRDTRSKSIRAIVFSVTAGSDLITLNTGTFQTGLSTESYNDALSSWIEVGGTTTALGTRVGRILSIVDSTHAHLEDVVTTTRTSVTGVLRPDYGNYDENMYSVDADGVLSLRINTTADRVHHTGALIPRLAGGTDDSNVLGGRFTYCIRCPQIIDGYKVAMLLWPQTNSSKQGGEQDWPEVNLYGNATVHAFIHFDDNSNQYSFSTSVVFTDNQWHVYSLEWRPDQVIPTNTTVKVYVDDMVNPVGQQTGIHLPHSSKMHWVWQCETGLDKKHLVSSNQGLIQWKWATYEAMV